MYIDNYIYANICGVYACWTYMCICYVAHTYGTAYVPTYGTAYVCTHPPEDMIQKGVVFVNGNRKIPAASLPTRLNGRQYSTAKGPIDRAI